MRPLLTQVELHAHLPITSTAQFQMAHIPVLGLKPRGWGPALLYIFIVNLLAWLSVWIC